MTTNPYSDALPRHKSFPVSSSAIQTGADDIVALIEQEKVKAVANSRQDLLELANQSIQIRNKAWANHQTEIAQARRELLEVESRLKEASLAREETDRRFQELQTSSREECDKLRSQTSEALRGSIEAYKEAELARSVLDQLKADLEGVGIFYCGKNNLRFGAESWGDVLAELGITCPGLLTPEGVREAFGTLAQRLKGDRETLKRYEETLRLAEEERDQIKRDAHAEMEALRLQISSLKLKADPIDILTLLTENTPVARQPSPPFPPTSSAALCLSQQQESIVGISNPAHLWQCFHCLLCEPDSVMDSPNPPISNDADNYLDWLQFPPQSQDGLESTNSGWMI